MQLITVSIFTGVSHTQIKRYWLHQLVELVWTDERPKSYSVMYLGGGGGGRGGGEREREREREREIQSYS